MAVDYCNNTALRLEVENLSLCIMYFYGGGRAFFFCHRRERKKRKLKTIIMSIENMKICFLGLGM